MILYKTETISEDILTDLHNTEKIPENHVMGLYKTETKAL